MGDCIFWIYQGFFLFLSMSDIVLQVYFVFLVYAITQAVKYETKHITVAHCEAVHYKTCKKFTAQPECMITLLGVVEIQQ